MSELSSLVLFAEGLAAVASWPALRRRLQRASASAATSIPIGSRAYPVLGRLPYTKTPQPSRSRAHTARGRSSASTL
jgi:hypothetical protein